MDIRREVIYRYYKYLPIDKCAAMAGSNSANSSSSSNPYVPLPEAGPHRTLEGCVPFQHDARGTRSHVGDGGARRPGGCHHRRNGGHDSYSGEIRIHEKRDGAVSVMCVL